MFSDEKTITHVSNGFRYNWYEGHPLNNVRVCTIIFKLHRYNFTACNNISKRLMECDVACCLAT